MKNLIILVGLIVLQGLCCRNTFCPVSGCLPEYPTRANSVPGFKEREQQLPGKKVVNLDSFNQNL